MKKCKKTQGATGAKEAGAQGNADQNNTKKNDGNDDVIDADFKEV